MLQSPPKKVQAVENNGGVLKKTVKAKAAGSDLKDTLNKVKDMAEAMLLQSEAAAAAVEERARQAERDRKEAERAERDDQHKNSLMTLLQQVAAIAPLAGAAVNP